MAVGSLLALVGAIGSARGDSADEGLARLAHAAGQGARPLRVGLPARHAIVVDSDGPFRILDPATGQPVWRKRFVGEVRFVAEGGPPDGADSVFRVQVGAFSSAAAAERELRRLEPLVGGRGVVRHDVDRGSWRVRIGEAADRLALGPLVDRLREQGIEGSWIVEEPRDAPGDVRLRLVDASYESAVIEQRRLAVVPADDRPLRVEGKSYRGVIELRIGPFGTAQPVNWIELERYLLGVVPAELGPEVWPQLEALKAQAIAARTYAVANLHQFEDQGFDLCSTPRCQVYEGAEAEHPLSSRAVWSTKGEILTWGGEPIAALYTATCGGHTEDGGEIFPEHAAPYLRGVPCTAEGDAVASQRARVEGRTPRPATDETGADVTRDWALLAVAGVLGPEIAADPSGPERPLDSAGLRDLTRALARLSGRPEPDTGLPAAATTLAQAAAAVVADLGWEDRARVLISEPDLPALLRDPDLAPLSTGERRVLAYLASVEGLRPHGDGSFRPQRAATRARLAPLLVRIGDSYEAFGLRTAVVSGVRPQALRLVQGSGELRLPVAPEIALFGRTGGRAVAVRALELWPGDRVRFHTAGGAIDFLELLPPVKGAADDRSAKVYSWEVRRTRNELEQLVRRRVSVGRLLGLEVLRRGVSGRVVELRVVGTEGSTVVRGFDVRRLLDLRESLLVIESQYDADGRLEAVVFAGKGWGHGVGLCQVGAYGMALRGSGYREILAHYYSGAEIEKVDAALR